MISIMSLTFRPNLDIHIWRILNENPGQIKADMKFWHPISIIMGRIKTDLIDQVIENQR